MIEEALKRIVLFLSIHVMGNIIIAALAIYLVLRFTGPSSDEFRSYGVFCKSGEAVLPLGVVARENAWELNAKRRSACNPMQSSVQYYKYNAARSEMYNYMSDSFYPLKSINCIVFDMDNWTCDYEDGPGGVAVKGGLQAISSRHTDYNFNFVHRWQWWTIGIMTWLGWDRPGFLIPEQQEAPSRHSPE